MKQQKRLNFNSVERGKRSIRCLLTLRNNLTKLGKKERQSSISHCLIKNIWNFLGNQLHLSTVRFDLNCSFFNYNKKDRYFLKRPTDYNPNYFWVVTVQDWTKTSRAIAVRPLNTLNCFKCYRSR